VALPPQRHVRELTLMGHYGDGNARTRVLVNGIDLGWAALDQARAIELPDGAAADGRLHIELRHESPRAPNSQDRRLLAYFLQGVTVR
jgi:hypothetical protein